LGGRLLIEIVMRGEPKRRQKRGKVRGIRDSLHAAKQKRGSGRKGADYKKREGLIKTVSFPGEQIFKPAGRPGTRAWDSSSNGKVVGSLGREKKYARKGWKRQRGRNVSKDQGE